LEIARGIAALWVVLFHMEGLFHPMPDLFKAIIAKGHFGVPMFFVISGFVITYSAESSLKARRSPFHFLKNRLRRIYPTFWCSVLVCLCLPYLMALVSMLKTGEYQIPLNPIAVYDFSEWFHFLLLTKIFFAEGVNLHSQFKALNPVYWTIAIEIQFYLVVFVGLFFKQYYRWFITIIALIALTNSYWAYGFNFGFFIHFWLSFCVGIGLAYLVKQQINLARFIPNKLTYTGAVTLISLTVSTLLITLDIHITDFIFALLFGLFLWLIAPLESVMSDLKTKNNVLIKIPMQALLILGAMSYSVYLLHFNLYRLAEMFVRQVISEQHLAFGFCCVLVTLVICYPFYFLIERRFMSKKYNQLQDKTLKTKAVTE
jgi:peptidoglycan/LPS O-acetylase OafA/YrhL